MKKEVDDAALAYVFNLVSHVYPQSQGELKRHLKGLMRKLSPPRTHINLTQKQTEVLLGLLDQASAVLETKTDEHSVKVKQVMGNLKETLNEIA